jgi:hypothetical protein
LRRAKARRIAPGARAAQAEAHGGFAGEQPQVAPERFVARIRGQV